MTFNRIKEIHLLPFYIVESKSYKISNYCDLSKQKENIRGMKCVKTQFPVDIPVYKDGKLINNNIIYWKQEENENNIFNIGFELLSGKTDEKKFTKAYKSTS